MFPSPGNVVGRVRELPGQAARIAEQLVLSAGERTLEVVLKSELIDAFARDVVRYRVLQRVTDPLVDGDAIDEVGRPLAAHVIDSGVVDEVVERLLENERFWLLIDEVASSPAVTDAISHQSAGFAEQMAEVVRDRSRNADARLERAARRIIRRPERSAEPELVTPDPSGP